MRNLKTFLVNLSNESGVYQMLGQNGEVLYVGKAKNLKKRISSYFSGKAKDLKTLALVKLIKDIDFTVTHSEMEAVLLECNLIKKHHPRYNVLLRDDKSYPYIVITTQHHYPRIDLYRGIKKKNNSYFGPYPSAYAARETISLLQKLFHIRTCTDTYFAARTRPCLLHQIGRCTGPCVGLINKEDYKRNVELAVLFLQGKSDLVIKQLQQQMENASIALHYELAASLRNQIARLRQMQERQYVANVMEGSVDVIGIAISSGVICIQLLNIRNGQVLGSRSYFPSVPPHSAMSEILFAFLTQHYLQSTTHIESIPKQILIEEIIPDSLLLENVLANQVKHKVEIIKPLRGERKKWLDMATNSARQSLAAHIFNKTNIQERAIALQAILGLEAMPKRIECFDISHTMGEVPVASCVVFDLNGPIKSNYRRFNITDITPGDDVAAMHQVLLRRFKRLQKEELTLPDIVFIDGGITQLSAASQVMQSLNIVEVLLVGISKGPHRKAGFETLHRLDHAPIHLPADSIVLHFIQQIRDEAHRFAITGHRLRRDKIRKQSTLEQIPGIGAKRRRELLRYFGGLQGIAHASLNEIAKVPGINRSLAERIYVALHETAL